MWIEVGTLFSKLTRSTEEEKDWVWDYLSFEDEQKRFRGGKRNKVNKESLFQTTSGRFPAGFTNMVAKAAREEGYTVELIDARKAPVEPDEEADLEWLRDYQAKAVKTIMRRKRGILQLATGAGKTEIAVGLTRALPCKWLAVVHRSQLADDIANRYEARSPGLSAGRILEGRWDVPKDATLVCATFQSLQAALKRGLEYGPDDPEYVRVTLLLKETEGLLVDECHTLPANTFYNTAMQTSRAYYRVGLSGTPLARGDRKSMYSIAALGPVVYQVKAQQLIDLGFLSRPTVRLLTCTMPSARPTWDGVYKDVVVRSDRRNNRVLGAVKRATLPALVFVTQVAHGKALTKRLMKNGIKAEFVWGSHSIDYRKSIIRRLVAGHFDVIVCSSVFNEGIDIPELRAVVLAGGGKSIIATLQRLGRGMRIDRKKDGTVAEGGDKFEVWDIFDRGNKWTERHARERLRAYTGEGFETFIEDEPPSSLLEARP